MIFPSPVPFAHAAADIGLPRSDVAAFDFPQLFAIFPAMEMHR
jgi:hypothetical protein